MTEAKYQFPEYYNWPYFFTIQKHTQTKEKQLQMWVDLALNYCKENKIFKMTKSNFLNTLGVNKIMKRKLNIDAVNIIFDYALEKNFFKQIKKDSKEDVYVLWRSIQDWGKYFHDCAVNQHKIDGYETFDHILNDDSFRNEDFFQMDQDFLLVVLIAAEEAKLCQLGCDDRGELVCVKFNK